MSDEDVWGHLTRQLFPLAGTTVTSSRNNGTSGTKTGAEAKDAGEADSNKGEDGEQGTGHGPGVEKDRITAARAFESYALCVGMPGAGKSSLLNVYLNPSNDGVPKPTIALEYMFARRANAANAPKVGRGQAG